MLEPIEETREDFTAPLGALADLIKSDQKPVDDRTPLFKSNVRAGVETSGVAPDSDKAQG